MNLQSLSKEYITQNSKEKLLKELNTNNSGMLDKFLSSKSISWFLKNGYFDYKYTSKEFIKTLSSLLNYQNLNEEISLSRDIYYKEKEENRRVCSVKLRAFFEKRPKGFFSAVAYNAFANVKVDKETLLCKTDDEITQLLKLKAKEHYLKNEDNKSAKEMFGNILFYFMDIENKKVKLGFDELSI